MRRRGTAPPPALPATSPATRGRERGAFSDLQLAEEVVALVVGDDEGRGVLDRDAPDRLHAELGIFQPLALLDAVLGKDRGGSADRAEIEALVLLAGIDDLLAAVALGQHHHRAAMGLEEVDVGIHAAGRRRAE